MSNAISIRTESLPFLSLPLYLNNMLPIKSIQLVNESDRARADLELRIHADLPCFEAFDLSLAEIPAQTSVKAELAALKINRSYLSALSESEKAQVKIELWQGEELLAIDSIELRILPLEHFGGFNHYPELIASYVTPNHPYIYELKRKAAKLLEDQGLKAQFEGYQADQLERVLQIMSALYSAIKSEELIYSSLAPGYEEAGQRLRLVPTIQHERFANCIDLSLLYAACLEAADLHPIILIVPGHAFVGCWLCDSKFAEIINDDKSAISKRLAKGISEIALVEATTMSKASLSDFTEATHLAEIQLTERDEFLLSVDIKRARLAGIRPLPLLIEGEQSRIDEQQLEEQVAMVKEFDLGTIYHEGDLLSKESLSKQELWERKLLDLSLRNNLLNLRFSRGMLQLVNMDICQLEDLLYDGDNFGIEADPQAEPLRKYNLFKQALHPSSERYIAANEDLKDKRLSSYYHRADLDSILQYIHKNAKVSIEENGSSTLYLAMGLLKWYDRKTPDQARYAPILLLPVELSRRSSLSKFQLKGREEESMINITLLEYLRQEYQINIAGLDPLPSDEHGVDVAKVMALLRRAVMQLKGWDVEEQLVLGNFSFNKLLLWNDLVLSKEKLLDSEIVRSLSEGKLCLSPEQYQYQAPDYEALSPSQLALPIATDCSQLSAVYAAQQGLSFVLHGPPGTGKSQTITNIIADALYQGKRVLFVAAKKVALDVVYKRLEKIGLANFSLELHSNKSKKSDVLAQLARSLERLERNDTVDYEGEAQRLQEAKKAISTYIDELHRKQSSGWSLYDHVVGIEEHRTLQLHEELVPDAVLHAIEPKLWQQWQDWLPQYGTILGEISHPAEHPFAQFTTSDFTPQQSERLRQLTIRLEPIFPALSTISHELVDKLKLPFEIENATQLQALYRSLTLLQKLPNTALSLCLYAAKSEHRSYLAEWLALYDEFQQRLQVYRSNYRGIPIEQDLSSWRQKWEETKQSWFLVRYFKQNSFRKAFKTSSGRKSPFANAEELDQFFEEYDAFQKQKKQVQEERYAAIPAALQSLYKPEHTDRAAIEQRLNQLEELVEQFAHWEPGSFGRWIQSFIDRGLTESDELIQPIHAVIRQYQTDLESSFRDLEEYQALTGIRFEKSSGLSLSFAEAEHFAKQLSEHLPQLNAWVNYKQIERNGKALQLAWLIDAYNAGKMLQHQIKDYCSYNLHRSLAMQVLAANADLHHFNVAIFESKIEHYKELAAQFKEITQRQLLLKLSAQVPEESQLALRTSEIAILRRAISNRARGLSIRKLFDQIPTLLPRLAPCMLMSPLSSAQYFDANKEHFDLLIFDEASQLPTSEAISALARAKQAIIVGDPKQMPPSTFFSSNRIDEDNIDIEDLESILDDCLALSLPSLFLLRHYRSRHESLIAFSNSNFYENKLLTFPSADDMDRKLQYHHVPGYYDMGKSRKNKFEAEAIVKYIREHYADPNRRQKSIGVVTFSQVQQTLVEDLLQEAFMQDSEFEQQANEAAEPLFVKNLENVQGDERDIILFSICYAPDEQGKMIMNFGPLNRDGGWRRLNVAVTRARYEMHVFATLRSDEIDLNRTSAEGVSALKGFLKYAESGLLSKSASSKELVQKGQKSLAEPICQRLQERGLKVRANVGTSDFKVDIAIQHPDRPELYLLGILIDGRNYHEALTSNDRETVMPPVLNGLGWNLFRIWTLDWMHNADAIVERILTRVEELRHRAVDSQAKEQPAKPQSNEQKQEEPIRSAKLTKEELPDLAKDKRELKKSATSKEKPYQVAALRTAASRNPNSFFDENSESTIARQLIEIAETEAPISQNWLFKRLLSAWGISRLGPRNQAHLLRIAQGLHLPYTEHQQRFYWKPSNASIVLEHYRSNAEEKRPIEEIAPEELSVAIEETVQQALSISEEELLRYVAKLFGFARMGSNIDTAIRYAIDLSLGTGNIRREGDRICIV